MTLRILVCGGRNYFKREVVVEKLDGMLKHWGVEVVIHGGATGADSLAAWWAERRDIPCLRVPAEWSKLGRKAGPIRNALMLRLGQPNLVLAFPGGMGTRNMTDQAIAAGIAVEWAPEDELPE